MWTEIPKPTKTGRWLRKYLLPEEWVKDVGAKVENECIVLVTDEDVLEWQIVYRSQETLVYVCTETTFLGTLYKYVLLALRSIKED
jgi:hypothetical protein